MKKISTTLLSSRELSTLTQRVQSITEKVMADDAFYALLGPKLEECNNRLLNSIDKTLVNRLTEQLSHKDLLRDKAFIAFRDFCKACSNFNDSAVRKAAKKVVALIERIGWTLYLDGYAAQSARLESLFVEIDGTGYEGNLKTINALQWYEGLKRAQQSFEATYSAKNNLAIERGQNKIKQSRGEVISYLRPLLAYIEVMSKMLQEKFIRAEDEINEVIADLMAIARSRQTRNENLDSDNPESPEPPIPETEPREDIND